MSVVVLPFSNKLVKTFQRFLLGLSGATHNLLRVLDAFWLHLGCSKVMPLGPLLFSLVLLQFIDFVKLHDLVKVHLWHLDDGTFIDSKCSLLKLLDSLSVYGPQFGHHSLNLSKCELFWPSGDSFPEFPTNINRGFGALRISNLGNR